MKAMNVSKPRNKCGYRQIIELRVPIRFYWHEKGFDGIDIGPCEGLTRYQSRLMDKILEAIGPAIDMSENG